VSEVGRPASQRSMLKVDANKFAPQGSNPNELREKVKEVKEVFATIKLCLMLYYVFDCCFSLYSC